MERIPSSQITPENIYFSRRHFIQSSLLTAGGAILAACAPGNPISTTNPTLDSSLQVSATTDELGIPVTSYYGITNYTNFYEFTPAKTRVADLAKDFPLSPWQIQIGGLVNHPGVYDIDDLVSQFDPGEHILRMRCVETWAMVIPWNGFPLSRIIKLVEPTSDAHFVRFESMYNPNLMPGQSDTSFSWPYVEGLRLDEAMHELTLLATGIYGKPLTPQNGGPIRLVVPWKYGFKSIKSLVKIDFVAEMPTSFWTAANPREYGFYANVNPEVPHPRWSQSEEQYYNEQNARPTQLFNGYQDKVSSLYSGLDLKTHF